MTCDRCANVLLHMRARTHTHSGTETQTERDIDIDTDIEIDTQIHRQAHTCAHFASHLYACTHGVYIVLLHCAGPGYRHRVTVAVAVQGGRGHAEEFVGMWK